MTTAATQLLASGQRVDQYEVLRHIGAGGMADVYLAHDVDLERPVALKVLRPVPGVDDHVALREARATAALAHPNVVTIYGVGRLQRGVYLALELVDGEPLERRLARGRPPLEQAKRLARDVASGLSAAHERALIHGDVTANNVMVGADGRARVLDFGLAMARDVAESQTGPVAGTPGAIAPERWHGSAPTPAGDIWALGVLLYRLFIDASPPPSSRYEPYEPEQLAPALSRSEAPRPLQDLIARCLSMDPAARPSAAHAQAMLSRLSAERPAPFVGVRALSRGAPFAGREDALESLRDALSRERVVGLSGPAASGKRSLCAAGLGPELEAARLYQVVLLERPPSAEMLERERSTRRQRGAGRQTAAPRSLEQRMLEQAPTDAAADAGELAPLDRGGDLPPLWVVDVRGCAVGDAQQAAAWRGALVEALARVDDAALLLIGDDAARIAALAPERGRPLVVVALEAADELELEEMLLEPLRSAGVRLEDAQLPRRIAAELSGRPAALPLLQLSGRRLVQLADAATRRVPPRAFERLGGVLGAAIEHADNTLDALRDDELRAAREMLLSLVDEAGSSRPRAVAELLVGQRDEELARAVLARLSRQRVLVANARGQLTLLHAALAQRWPRLSAWRRRRAGEDAAGRYIAVAARRWHEGGERDADLLEADLLGEADLLLAGARDGDAARRELLARFVQRSRDVRGDAPFVGRGAELAQLSEALDGAAAGRLRVVRLRGPAGIGKSALIARFVRDAELAGRAEAFAARDAGAGRARLESVDERERPLLVLRGRCYEHSAIPFGPWHALVEGVAAYVERLLPTEAAALLPPDARALARLFPAIQLSLGVEPTSAAEHEGDRRALLAEASRALRALLAGLARQVRLVLVIDDLQWADADSRELLEALWREPAPALLCLISERESTVVAPASAEQMIEMRALPPDEAQALARSLARSEGAAERLAEESGGVPLLLAELARAEAGPGTATLAELVQARVASLGAAARQLLEALAVWGQPSSRALVRAFAGELSGASSTEADDALLALRGAALMQRVAGDRYAFAHDRVRELLLDALARGAVAVRMRARHAAIARALARRVDDSGGEGEAEARHWAGAGEGERAARCAEQAADRAVGALAFARAESLYRLALECGADGQRLGAKLGDALRYRGAHEEAARAYLEAAGSGGLSDSVEALSLRARAANALFYDGDVDGAEKLLQPLLVEIGLRPARSRTVALARLSYELPALMARGMTPRTPQPMSEREAFALEIAVDAVNTIAARDFILGIELHVRHVRRALDSGQPLHVAQALARQAVVLGVAIPSRREQARELLRRAMSIAERHPRAELEGHIWLCRALVDGSGGRWRHGFEQAERARQIYRERWRLPAWQANMARMISQLCLTMLGRPRAVSARRAELLAEADPSGGGHIGASLELASHLHWLITGRIAEGRETFDAVERRLRTRTHTQPHEMLMFARCLCDRYEEKYASAMKRIEDSWALITSSTPYRSQLTRCLALRERGNTALAWLNDGAAAGGQRDELLAIVEDCARRLARERAPWPQPVAAELRAGASLARGDKAQAIAELARAADEFRQAEMRMHAMLARRARGVLVGGDVGSRLVGEVDAWLEEQSVADAERFSRAVAPGFWRR